MLRQFGATIEKRADGQYLEAPQRLRGTKIRLPYPSVGSTEQVLLTAVLAEGVTELSQRGRRAGDRGPHLRTAEDGRDHLDGHRPDDPDHRCRQARRLHPPRRSRTAWRPPPGRRAALATEGNIYVRGAQQRSMMTFLNTFRKVGGAFEIDDEGIRFWHPGGPLKAIALETDVHPGFQTDWQQPLVVALTQATGLSIVHETVYESRLGFTSALNQMGAHIQLYRECLGGSACRFGQRNFLHSAVVSGPTKLQGADLVIPDLRGGFSYLIAALAAQGTSRVHGIDLINRGYENFMEKLVELGAKVELPGGTGTARPTGPSPRTRHGGSRRTAQGRSPELGWPPGVAGPRRSAWPPVARTADLLALGGFLELGARGDLHAVAGRDLDRVAGLRVARGASGTVGALEGQEAGDGDLLVALGDDLADGLGEGGQNGVGVLAGHLGALGQSGHQLTAVHVVTPVFFLPVRREIEADAARALGQSPDPGLLSDPRARIRILPPPAAGKPIRHPPESHEKRHWRVVVTFRRLGARLLWSREPRGSCVRHPRAAVAAHATRDAPGVSAARGARHSRRRPPSRPRGPRPRPLPRPCR